MAREGRRALRAPISKSSLSVCKAQNPPPNPNSRRNRYRVQFCGAPPSPARAMVIKLAPLDNRPALPPDIEMSSTKDEGSTTRPEAPAAPARDGLQIPSSDSFSSRQQSKMRQTLHMRREQLRRHHLPCWDESDDGVPPFCRGGPPVACWKVFNGGREWVARSRCSRPGAAAACRRT